VRCSNISVQFVYQPLCCPFFSSPVPPVHAPLVFRPPCPCPLKLVQGTLLSMSCARPHYPMPSSHVFLWFKPNWERCHSVLGGRVSQGLWWDTASADEQQRPSVCLMLPCFHPFLSLLYSLYTCGSVDQCPALRIPVPPNAIPLSPTTPLLLTHLSASCVTMSGRRQRRSFCTRVLHRSSDL